jgi:mono/diheme cytochrome c family protein
MLNRNAWMLAVFLLLTGCAGGVTPTPEARAESSASGDCPQGRNTPSAPAEFQTMENPKAGSSAAVSEGETLFQKTAKPFACAVCHGVRGDGKGDPDFESTPPARNFTCAATMASLKDGQLFWIIKNGSPQTSMPAFKGSLSDDQVWSLVAYIRSLAH